MDSPGARVAAALDLRLPTGDADNLLGTGTTQTKIYGILSTGTAKFAQHVNFGYTFSGTGDLDRFLPQGLSDGTVLPNVTIGSVPAAGNGPTAQHVDPGIFGDLKGVTDELNFAGGVEWAASGRVTVIGDVIGRSLRGAGRFDLETKSLNFTRCASSTDCVTAGQTGTTAVRELAVATGDVNQFYGTAGVKVNPAGNLLVGASVLFPLSDRGLRSKYTTVIGVEYAF